MLELHVQVLVSKMEGVQVSGKKHLSLHVCRKGLMRARTPAHFILTIWHSALGLAVVPALSLC